MVNVLFAAIFPTALAVLCGQKAGLLRFVENAITSQGQWLAVILDEVCREAGRTVGRVV